MIRPFRLRDSYLLQKLARQSVPLHMERHLTQPRWPLGMALSAPVPWYGSGVATFVRHSNDHSPNGFVQANKHLGRSEADVCYIAPKLEQHPDTSDTWRALLKHLIAHAGDFGIQRLYACLPAQDEAAEIVASGGFALYVRETLFRLPSASPVIGHGIDPNVRPQREIDSFALQRLSDRTTPPVVQKAEGAFIKENDNANHHLIFQNWWQPDRMEGLVYESEGDILGAMRIRRGHKGHWIHFLGDATRRDIVIALLNHALRLLGQGNLPVYCGVRSYQSSLGTVLLEAHFEPMTELARFVRHTTVRLREPVTGKKRLLVETTFPGIISSDVSPKSETSAKS